MPRTDGELLEAWTAGDPTAGNELFERHYDALYRFFRNKLDEDIDDLIQQTLLSCVQGKAGFREKSSFRTWLFTIARNELYDYWRARQRGPGREVGEVSLIDMGTSPSGVVARRREHQHLLTALRAIPLDLQVVLELFYWEQLDGPEIAEILGVPEGTARSRLRRAREAVAEEIAAMRKHGSERAGATPSDLDAWAAEIRAELVSESSP
jgi:RNA polymerase sigma-70 factor (ECF subfamily)